MKKRDADFGILSVSQPRTAAPIAVIARPAATVQAPLASSPSGGVRAPLPAAAHAAAAMVTAPTRQIVGTHATPSAPPSMAPAANPYRPRTAATPAPTNAPNPTAINYAPASGGPASAPSAGAPIQPDYAPLPSYVPPSGGATDDGGDGGFDDWQDSLATPKSPLAMKALSLSSAATALQTATVSVKPSFWKRLLALFGFGDKPTVTISGEPTSLQAMTESLVRRTRNGDQNAMALMALVRDQAKTGNVKCQQSATLINEYIRTHPVADPNPRIGGDVETAMSDDGAALYADAIALSHGPLLSNPRIEAFLSHFSPREQEAIRYGMANLTSAEQHIGVRMGKILGHARRLQAVRMPHSPISKFDAKVGCELDD